MLTSDAKVYTDLAKLISENTTKNGEIRLTFNYKPAKTWVTNPNSNPLHYSTVVSVQSTYFIQSIDNPDQYLAVTPKTFEFLNSIILQNTGN